MNIALIAAAGSGSRMDSARAKQFLELDGVPILIHTLQRFEASADIDSIVVVVPSAETSAFLTMAARHRLEKITRVVSGGAERQESVYRGLQTITNPKVEVVIVHDGVRPFITAAQISAVIERARDSGAAIMALPVTDTVKEVDGGAIVRTIPRERIFLAQTPQAFRLDLLFEAHRRAHADGFVGTDDAALVERLGGAVSIVEGSPRNIKITRPRDLPLAELILREGDF